MKKDKSNLPNSKKYFNYKTINICKAIMKTMLTLLNLPYPLNKIYNLKSL